MLGDLAARRASSSAASASVSSAMLDPPRRRHTGAALSCVPSPRHSAVQQALGLGPRLIGDLGAGQHAGNLLAPGRSLQLLEAW